MLKTMNYMLKGVKTVKTIIKATIGYKLNFGFLFNMVLKMVPAKALRGNCPASHV